MNFDDKFMGILSMLGGMKNNGNNLLNMESIAPLLGLMSSMGGGKGVDIMKILPLLTTLKGGNPLGNVFQSFQPQETKKENPLKTPRGYKDKYEAIAFAGNEVIYTLGKLWKVQET